MILTINHNSNLLKVDLSRPMEISIPVQRKNSVSSFGINGATYIDYVDGNFVGNKNKGGPCNLETITFTPHGNSTHTECLGHIAVGNQYYVNECIEDQFYNAKVITLSKTNNSEESPLDFSQVNFDEMANHTALIIRSLPNSPDRINHDYSGKNAPYITTSDMERIKDSGIKHLIIDLPSVDPEWDNGSLAAHHIFWNYPSNPRVDASITEFAFIPEYIADGSYVLKLNISPFESDAAPSRPVIYPIIAG